MTDQERAALLAWLDERIAECERNDTWARKYKSVILQVDWESRAMAYNAVKAHIESEATHDEA